MSNITSYMPNATYSNSGKVRYGATSEVKSGVGGVVVTPVNLKEAVGFIQVFTSPPLTYVQGGGVTIAHPLGRKPKFLNVMVKCISPNQGYQLDDELHLNGFWCNISGGISCVTDVNNIYGRFSNDGNLILPNKTTGQPVACIKSSFEFYVSVWG